MLKLDKKIKLTKEVIQSANLCDMFSDADLDRIGTYCWEGYSKDKQSRQEWEERNKRAIDMAMQIGQAKNFPWPNCSNVIFPLLEIAAIQFHSRAFPNLIQEPNLVHMRVLGSDPDNMKTARAARVSRHMSWQLTEQDERWTEQHDTAFYTVSIVGCTFIKTRYRSDIGGPCSDHVLASDLVIDYYAKSVSDAARKTQIILMDRNTIYENVMEGKYRDVLDEEWFQSVPSLNLGRAEAEMAERHGMSAAPNDDTTPRRVLEQHCRLDLDGDGYAEPYVVIFDEQARKVLRIFARFFEEDVLRNDGGRVVRIQAHEYFTKIPFIPSPDGAIYDIGYGILLGHLNEVANSAINQLFDSGTMATNGGGFLARGVRIRAGQYAMAPFQWNPVDCSGDDLRKGIFPLPVREPSGVLFQLLQFIVEYANRVSGTTELLIGENPGQNTPAETARTMVQQGQKIYNAIYKRIWKALKEEFKLIYDINARSLDIEQTYGDGEIIYREDYIGDNRSVMPFADPHIASDDSKLQQAIAVKQAAATSPGYDIDRVERMYLQALKVIEIDKIYPGPQKIAPPQNPKVVIEQIKAQTKAQTLQSRMKELLIKLSAEQKHAQAQTDLLAAQTAQILSETQVGQAAHNIEVFKTKLAAMQAHHGNMQAYMKLLQEHQRDANAQAGGTNDDGSGMESVEGAVADAGSADSMPSNG